MRSRAAPWGYKLVESARTDPHQFVRQAAELCSEAPACGEWQPFIWDDMTRIAAGAESRLDVRARQLIGEIVLALNMNEHADPQPRLRFGTSDRLPACLEKSAFRHEILGRGTEAMTECPFADERGCLCPYS